MSRYFLIPAGLVLDVLRERADLVRSYATAQPADRDDIERVLEDALCEVSVWSDPSDWREGYRRRESTNASLFWAGDGRIRQAVHISGGTNGWREVEATKVARKTGPERAVDAVERGRWNAHQRVETDGIRFAQALISDAIDRSDGR